MSRWVLLLAVLLASCGGRRDAAAHRPEPTEEAPPAPPAPPVPVTLSCGHVHAELPPGSHVTNLEPCLLPWNGVDRADGEGFVGGGSSLLVSLGGCRADLYVEEVAVDVPVPATPLSHLGPDERGPSDVSFNGPRSHVSVTAGVMGGGPECGATRDRVLSAIANGAHVDGPPAAARARFVLAEDGTALTLDVPDRYLVGYAGTETDGYVTAWRIVPREGTGPDASLTTYHDVDEDGSRPRHPRMPTLETHRLFGRLVNLHAPSHDAADEPGNGTRLGPCVAATILVGRDALVTTVSVCGPDGPERQRLYESLGSATVLRR